MKNGFKEINIYTELGNYIIIILLVLFHILLGRNVSNKDNRQ